MERERDLEAWMRRKVGDLGGVFWKFTSPGQDGVPDRIAIFPDGRLVFVELKTRTGTLSKVQQYQIRRLMELGQQVCVVRGKAGAEQFLKEMAEHVTSCVDYAEECIDLEELL